MKRTYIKPLTVIIAASDPLLAGRSWAVGQKYSGDGKKLDIEDPLTDMGKVITDEDRDPGSYDPWNSSNW